MFQPGEELLWKEVNNYHRFFYGTIRSYEVQREIDHVELDKNDLNQPQYGQVLPYKF